MKNQKVSLFDAIGMTGPESFDPVKPEEARSDTKTIRLPTTYVAPQARHRFRAAEILAAWHRILGVELDTQVTARNLARLEQWLGTKESA